MFRLGIEPTPSDYDVQVSSDEIAERAQRRVDEFARFNVPLTNPSFLVLESVIAEPNPSVEPLPLEEAVPLRSLLPYGL